MEDILWKKIIILQKLCLGLKNKVRTNSKLLTESNILLYFNLDLIYKIIIIVVIILLTAFSFITTLIWLYFKVLEKWKDFINFYSPSLLSKLKSVISLP